MTATETRPEVSATWERETVRVRSVKVTRAYYLPDANGTFVLVARETGTARKNASRVVMLETVTTRAKRETATDRLYRLDTTATARDRETLIAFRNQTVHANHQELWSLLKAAYSTVNYV